MSLSGITQHKLCKPHCRGPPCCLCVNWSTYRLRSIPSPSIPPSPLFVVSPSYALSLSPPPAPPFFFFFPEVHCHFRRFHQTDPFGYHQRKHLGRQLSQAATEVALSRFRSWAPLIVNKETLQLAATAVFCCFPLETCVLWGLVWTGTTSYLSTTYSSLVDIWLFYPIRTKHWICKDLLICILWNWASPFSIFLWPDTLKAAPVAWKTSIRLYQFDLSG